MRNNRVPVIALVSACIVAAMANGAFAADAGSAQLTGRRMHEPATTAPNSDLNCPKGEIAIINPTTGKQSCGPADMAVKGSGVPKNTTTTAPMVHRTVDSASPN